MVGAALLGTLLVCLFAPYGWFSAGGNTLRLDHLTIPTVGLFLLVTGRLRRPSPLALVLFANLAVALLVTTMFREFAKPLDIGKNLEGMLRGPVLMTIAASVRWSERFASRIRKLLFVVMILLGVAALAERLLPTSNPFIEWLIQAYGGPVGDEGIYVGTNHKGVLLEYGRATTVFVTAPSLAMLASLCLMIVFVPGLGFTTLERASMAAAAVVAGVASASKTFWFSLPIIFVLILLQPGARRGRAIAGAAGVGLLLLAVASLDLGGEREGVLSRIAEGGPDLALMSGGRYSDEATDLSRTTDMVLERAPVLGYGMVQVPGLYYADSMLNIMLLRTGILGVILWTLGIGLQARECLRVRQGWGLVAAGTLGLTVAFFLAGPVLVMPRIGDLLFVLMGLGAAYAREAHPSATAA